jgi:hypothetical protein
MIEPRFFKQYFSEDDLFLIKSFKTKDNQIVIETEENGKNIFCQVLFSKESAIDFANDLLKKANELK